MTVADFSQIKTKSLSEVIGTEIDGLRRDLVLQKLGISRTTCYRYLTCLLQERPKYFDYIPGNQYLSRGTLEALFQFQQLVERFQYEGAVPKIKKHMENYYELQASNQQQR
ncbi:hypothetical protein [Nostoc sp. FACHB-110]|uniref:hypothetical protein n=1 Tax=Nostoc sp. FACHB-110 TaxID=2692834 RepID=UPI001684725D|nr:hypothetical protein [Nostoc sp. FACHB-110]MBD2437330.1 hypothetical protein [Nostoc sp. FACHB-110]